MRYLVISSYPPMKCGIGKYAYQHVKSLEKSGNVVSVLSMEDGEGDFKENLRGWFHVLKVLKYSFSYEKIILQYQESFYYKDIGRLSRISTNIAFYILFILLKKKIKIVVHEMDYPQKRFEKILEQVKWFLCPKIIFHTEIEKEKFEKFYFKLSQNKFELLDPAEHFHKFRDITKKQAKMELGIHEDCTVFLCIGFIQPNKGFDRIVQAFKSINNTSMKLYIVGSIRLESFRDYFTNLQELVANTPNTFLLDKYVTDDLFDTWLIASDCVIVPYRRIWSSGVLTRAKLFNRPVIASNIGGLKDQIKENDILINDDNELRFVFEEFSRILNNN